MDGKEGSMLLLTKKAVRGFVEVAYAGVSRLLPRGKSGLGSPARCLDIAYLGSPHIE